MKRHRVGEQCGCCKKGSIELHYSIKKNNSGIDSNSAIFWKCDNPQCKYVIPAKENRP